MTDQKRRCKIDIESDAAHLQAAEWFVRLEDSVVSVEETLAWQQWLTLSEDNARAFARIEETALLVRQAPVSSMPTARQMRRDRYDAAVPLKEWREPAMLPRPWTKLALAASLAAVTLALAVRYPTFWSQGRSITSVLASSVGENKTIQLSDGSTIALGGDTRVEIAFSQAARALELVKGEALFTVARDASRPFQVRAGDARIVALGTAFNVQRGRDHATVSVTEGRVVVEPVSTVLPLALLRGFKPKLRAVQVVAGEQTTSGSAGIEAATPQEDPAAATAWQTGRLAFHLQPLRYVLEDVNRYASKPIVLEDDDVGALMITGTVRRENIAGWIESLERAFDLRAVEEADRIVIRAR